jgi:DNA-binding transcriptional regulator YhcF (GntR family)
MLSVDPDSSVPPYAQIVDQVRALANAGVLANGTRLPPIRQLAGDLGLAGGTVARAYRELEAEGVVITRGRHGTIVQAPANGSIETPAPLVDAARTYAEVVTGLGISIDDAVSALRVALSSPDLPGAKP